MARIKQLAEKSPPILREFFSFLKEYNIISLALAFIMGAASNSLVKSLVDNIIMPFINPLTATSWEEAVWMLGPVQIRWGAFTAELLHFIILALVVFVIGKKILKKEKPGQK